MKELNRLSPKAKLVVVNEGYHSDHWTLIAKDVPAKDDVLLLSGAVLQVHRSKLLDIKWFPNRIVCILVSWLGGLALSTRPSWDTLAMTEQTEAQSSGGI